MHCGMHRRQRFTKTSVLSNRFIAQLIHKIGTPIPLQPRGIQRVEHALQRRLRQRTYKIESRLLESADGFKCFFGLALWPGTGPNYAAHFFHVQMFRERRRGRHGKKSKKAIQIIRSSGNQVAIPFHYVGRFA